MTPYEREYFISRIRSGFYLVKLGQSDVRILTPTSEDEFFANQVFMDSFDKCRQDELMTEEEMFDWLRTQRGSAVRTPRAAEPEGEREVWRERVGDARPCMAQAPEPPPEPRARPQTYTLTYTFGAGNAAVAGVLEGFRRIAMPCYCSLKASLFLALGRLSLFLSLWIPFRQRNAKNK